MCAWFNEWHRFGERDQLSLSYVLHAMDLTPDVGEDTPRLARKGVFLWPRNEHWQAKREKPWRIVHYAGHGGIGTSSGSEP